MIVSWQKNIILIYCFLPQNLEMANRKKKVWLHTVFPHSWPHKSKFFFHRLFPSEFCFCIFRQVLFSSKENTFWYNMSSDFQIFRVWYKSSDIRKSDWLHFNSTYLLRICHMFQVWLSCCLWYKDVEGDRNLCKEGEGNHIVLQWPQKGKTFGIAEIHGMLWQ